ncbi:amino acid adenylation domain-containing protein [Streptomyces wedmorensis]|uniref:non-ribosomal peptide synthetase n=1 Tax=Streptomyces wedmorensis TaxID=43759 RepID=UPI00344641DE
MSNGNLWRAFVDVARAHPGRTAYAAPEGQVDYERLLAGAAALADRLAARNIGVGDLVAVDMPVGPGFVVAALAATAVGAAYLPLDVSAPAARRERILEHARPSVVLRPDDEDLHAAAALLEADPTPDSPSPDRHRPGTVQDDPAYVIYTSGSTGTPKGVVVPGRGVHGLLADFQSRAPLPPGSRHSWWTSPGFDVSVYEMWSALLGGGTVLPVPDVHRRDVDATLDYLAEQRVDSAYLPLQFLPALRDRLAGCGPAPKLRRLLTGVEPIPVGLLVALRALMPGMTVINGYGPTETTVCATLYTVPDHCGDPEKRTPIGSLVEGNRGFVVDEQLMPVTPGSPGELCVAGNGVALGYLHDQRLTAERFLPAIDGDGLMYRTGDIVMADARGELTFLGRLDDQLKVDGVRVEPAETEAALRRLDGITDVAVLARPATSGGPAVLTAFVVMAPTGRADGDLWSEIRERLAEELPAQAVPRRFVALDRIPMTSDGKLDRAGLPEPQDGPPRPARNDHERVVEAACREVLPHVPPAALDLGFTELGGDSLRAARLALALRSATRRAVKADHVVTSETLAALAALIPALPLLEESRPSGRAAADAPLTAGQIGMWAAELTGGAPGALHESVAVELTGDLDAGRVAEELAAVLHRHTVFRGRVDEDTERFVTDGRPVRVAEHSVASVGDVDQTWQRLLSELQHPAFDLDRGPLVRAAVLSAPGTVRVLLVWHHLVVDAWSARIVLEELSAALSDRAPRLVEEHGHAEYARRQQSYLDSAQGRLDVEAAADRVRAWLPADTGNAGPAQNSCRVEELAVGPLVWSRVRECARRNGTTAFAVTLGAVLDELCRLADTDGRFALAAADRDGITAADAAGYLLTTVPFGPRRGDDDRGTAAANDALRGAREIIAEAQALARIPFPTLMAELGVRDARRVAPLVIAWDNDPATALSVPGCEARSLPVDPLGARWPWTVLLTDCADRGMSGRIESPPWVPVGGVARFAQQLESVLDAFVSSV